MEFKRIGKVFLFSVAIAAVILASIQVCANLFTYDVATATMAALTIVLLSAAMVIGLLSIGRINRWLNK